MSGLGSLREETILIIRHGILDNRPDIPDDAYELLADGFAAAWGDGYDNGFAGLGTGDDNPYRKG